MATPDPDRATEAKDPYDGEYIGNIFGWKVSLIGLAVIVFFVSLVAYRHYSLQVPVGFDDPLGTEEEKAKYAPAPARRDTAQINQ